MMAVHEDYSGLTNKDMECFRELGYIFQKQIGSGSYAKVFLTEKKNGPTHEKYACKVIDSTDAPKEFAKKFLPRELDILTKVKHPNIIYIQGMYHRNGKIFIFMQNAEEGDLLEYILREQEISEQAAKIWTHQLIAALQYLHTLQIAHRDIKCENVLITHNMNAKLADFGFAKFVGMHNNKQVLSRTYCGSVAYAAPEIMRGKPYAPMVADIWSLGVVVYVLLNKSLPFPIEKSPPKAIYKMQMSKQWKFRSKAQSKFGQEAKDIIINMLEPDVIKRPTASSLLFSEWFGVATKDSRMFMELTAHERIALDNAVNFRIPTKDVLIGPNKFDLLEEKTDPFPSENIISGDRWKPIPQCPPLPNIDIERVSEVINIQSADLGKMIKSDDLIAIRSNSQPDSLMAVFPNKKAKISSS